MLSFLFTFTGSIQPGQYLLGSPRWATPNDLKNARLVATAGDSTDPTIFQLEINGSLTSKTFPVIPKTPGEKLNIVFNIGRTLNADEQVRIFCASGPTGSGALSRIGFNLSASESSTVIPTPSEMWVRYVGSALTARMFDYDTSTHLFSESSPGISTGLASLDNDITFIATIDGRTVAQSDASQNFKVNELICNGGTATSEVPRLEFMVGNTRIGTLTISGEFLVLDVDEENSVDVGTDRFCFYGNGLIAATLGPISSESGNILAAIQICEPATP